MPDHPGIFVLAGPNGAGKSSIGGEVFTRKDGAYFNPDLVTRDILQANPGMSLDEANGLAWKKGFDLLCEAIKNGTRYVFETTLGGHSVTQKLLAAAAAGIPIYVWYCALESPELHIARVAARVQKGGHDIPEAKIRERYQTSRENLVSLLPYLAGARIYDNSMEAISNPSPLLVLSMDERKVQHVDLRKTPEWAKPIVAAAAAIDPSFFPAATPSRK